MTNQIANTVWQQMRQIDLNLVFCMGVTKLGALPNGLRFDVKGLAFRGRIEITLNGMDLYDIKLIKPTRRQNQNCKDVGIKKFDTTYSVQEEVNDVYVEDLMPTLAMKVEGRE
jgi:hypothetical protein